MKYALSIAALIALSACQQETPKEPPKPVAPEFRYPNVAECKQSMDIAQQAAMLISFERGHKMDYIRRIWELTDDPIVRMNAQKTGDFLFAAHIFDKQTEPSVKDIKSAIETSKEQCNTFALK